MIAEFVLNTKEEGFIIVVRDLNDNKIKYIGKENTFIVSDEFLEQNVENECLDKLIIFTNDEDGICEAINEYRQKGIDARMYSVFRDIGHRILDYDETDGYIKHNLIIAI